MAEPEAIDTIAKLGFAHPMGPLALADFIGLDTCLYIAEVLHNLGYRITGSDQSESATTRALARLGIRLGTEFVYFERLLKPDAVEKSAEGFGLRIPIVPATDETLVEALRPLVEQPALRREIGAQSRAYVEQVHDIDRVADRLLDLYRSL